MNKMSYIDFQHDGIEYRLIAEVHYTKRNEPIEDLDALVIETGTMNQEKCPKILLEEQTPFLADFPESTREVLRERGFHIYSVDARLRLPYVVVIANMGMHFAVPPYMAYGAAKLFDADEETAQRIKEVTGNVQLANVLPFLLLGISGQQIGPLSQGLSKLNSYWSFLRQSPVEEYRNAIAAKKIKEGVVPRVRKRVKEDRPLKIGIKYGMLHTGIRECLENDARVSYTLGLQKWYGRFLMDKNSLNSFYEYTLEPYRKIIRVEKFQCPVYERLLNK